jgi:hypothetical protein
VIDRVGDCCIELFAVHLLLIGFDSPIGARREGTMILFLGSHRPRIELKLIKFVEIGTGQSLVVFFIPLYCLTLIVNSG